jgi:glycine betaine/proline transport system permease protein
MRIPIGVWVESAVEWLKDNMSGLFTFIKIGLGQVIDFFEMIFTLLPFVVMLIIIVLLALRTAGIKAAIFALLGLLLVYFTDLWTPSMETLAMITTATLIALVIGIPLGILMAKSNHANKIIRPILDFMQTMPSFVYLIPAVYFFGLGTVPGTIATIIFAMPPIVKLTDLGIRQVPKEVVEAASAFGATPFQKLAKVQLPLAMPTMLAGLNQTIMLSLSMVVISAMISAGGLGEEVYRGIGQMDIGAGFEGGLAVVIIAMVLDKITQSLGKENKGISLISCIKKLIIRIKQKNRVKQHV